MWRSRVIAGLLVLLCQASRATATQAPGAGDPANPALPAPKADAPQAGAAAKAGPAAPAPAPKAAPAGPPEARQQQPAAAPAPDPCEASQSDQVVASEALPKLCDDAMPKVIELKEDLIVRVAGFDVWASKHPADAQNLLLYINGYPVKRLTARDYEKDEVRLKLVRHPDSRAEWSELLGEPSLSPRPVTLRLGIAGHPPFDGSASVELKTMDGWYLAFAGAAFAGLFLLFVMIARGSDLLREGRMPVGSTERRPFSLGRTQMAVWFFIVIASFLLIWIVTGAYDPLTASVLALIGISAGTALGAMVIDANKEAAVDNRNDGLRNERLKIDADVAALQASLAQMQEQHAAAPPGVDIVALGQRIAERHVEIAGRVTRAQQVDDELRALGQRVQPLTSTGFWKDLLSDENGVSFHRFQIMAWTVVLAVIFCVTVYESLAMPDFDAKLLGLMGLSSGTYLGFKFPEVK
ncbi:hypothetical protein [Luteitalea sp.]|uniref:hypothetical protein n=1 Tax=Luteitalea sp. TaxID=2004800 RepID=UPI0025C67339|nr:hypothetical protein [Luteitalea sp.]